MILRDFKAYDNPILGHPDFNNIIMGAEKGITRQYLSAGIFFRKIAYFFAYTL